MTDNKVAARPKSDPVKEMRDRMASDIFQEDYNKLSDRERAEVDVSAVSQMIVGATRIFTAGMRLCIENYVNDDYKLLQGTTWASYCDWATPTEGDGLDKKSNGQIRKMRTHMKHYIPALVDPLLKKAFFTPDGSLIAISNRKGEVLGIDIQDIPPGTKIIDPLEHTWLLDDLGPVARALRDPKSGELDAAARQRYESLLTEAATSTTRDFRASLRGGKGGLERPRENCDVFIYNGFTPDGTPVTITEYRLRVTHDVNTEFVEAQLSGFVDFASPQTVANPADIS